jgi:GntR family transcriptional repressor for pyruvate dehydrogenase complex
MMLELDTLATPDSFDGGRRGPLGERVARAIERFVVAHDLKPGDRLPSGRELTERYGVSRTVVRDAIAILEQRGLVETRAGSGVFVRDGGSEAVADVLGQMLRRNAISMPELMETRQLLEVHNASLAARRVSPAGIAAMRDAIARMTVAVGPIRFVEADVAFHEALAEAAGNRVLASLLRSLRPLLLQGMLVGTALDGAREAAIEEHTAILGAIARGDGKTARGIMEGHLRRGFDEWIQAGFIDPATPLPEAIWGVE